jgi:hypothetical protein
MKPTQFLLCGMLILALLRAEGTPFRSADVVRATSFEVVGADGSVHARLGLGQDGRPALELLDADGTRAAVLALEQAGVVLRTYSGGAPCIELAQQETEHGTQQHLRFFSDEGEAAMDLGNDALAPGHSLKIRNPVNGSSVTLGLERYGLTPFVALRSGPVPDPIARAVEEGRMQPLDVAPRIRLDAGVGDPALLLTVTDRKDPEIRLSAGGRTRRLDVSD